MERIRKNERAENWICRYWLQIESCRQCLFDALCTLEDNNKQNDRRTNEEWTWRDN